LTVRNTELRDPIREYVVAVIDLVAERRGTKYPYENWFDAPDFPFIFLKDDISQLPEYKTCIDAILADAVVSSHFDQMVGISSRRSRSENAEALMTRLPHLGVYRNRIQFNEEFFEREYETFEATFYDDSFTFEEIAPLFGPVFTEPIRLSDDIEICRLNRYDLTALTEKDIDEDALWGNHLWAIRTGYKLPKVVGDDDPIDLAKTKRDDETRNRANLVIEQVLSCLRLLGVSNAYQTATVHRLKSWIFHDSREYSPKYLPAVPFSMELDAAFPVILKKLWSDLNRSSVRRHGFIFQAIKRFGYAHERHDWEDKIVDLLIAAEALFLSQMTERGELNYRLRLNAAVFLGGTPDVRRHIFRDMKNAYDLRSKIVHGSDTKKIIADILKAEDIGFGEEYKLYQFIYRIQEYIRIAIHRMINIAVEKKDGSELINWNDLLLGGVEKEFPEGDPDVEEAKS
jgi:Apea-like HEPN